jgi:hypothetical protein
MNSYHCILKGQKLLRKLRSKHQLDEFSTENSQSEEQEGTE